MRLKVLQLQTPGVILTAWCFLLGSLFQAAGAGPHPRAANTSLTLPQEPPGAGYAVVDAFEGLTFLQPVAMTSPPGETNRLFIIERKGRVMVITNLAQPTATLFLDLRGRVDDSDIESGLLGLAFHPQYASNGLFYVFRNVITTSPAATNAFHGVLARFRVSPTDPHAALLDSEERLIVQRDLGHHHNGGDLHFGPDGCLYVSLGDSTPPPEDQSALTHQPIDRGFFAGILRLDVDQRPGSLPPNPHPAVMGGYGIPPDNPFVGLTNYQGVAVDPGRLRTEFYAVGFRNPWRFSFHPVTGDMYACDVGEDQHEEINRVSAGGNYGWPYLEGLVPTSTLILQAPPGFQSLPPLVYCDQGSATNQGACIIGGVIYMGERIPRLTGSYIFGDFRRGHVWSLDPASVSSPKDFVRLVGVNELSCFGIDPGNGDVLIGNFGSGRIHRLIHTEPDQAVPFPQTLAQTGAFADLETLTPAPGIVPYEINLPFWSDHAIKTRWFALPDPAQAMTLSVDGNWQFPTGSVWIKHFEMELTNGVPASRRRLETRFIVRSDAGVYGVTYKWQPDGSATLVPDEGLDEPLLIHDGAGLVREQVWHYPGRAECIACHNEVAGGALGFTTAQLNREVDYGAGPRDQLQELARAGYLQPVLPDTHQFRTLVHPDDAHTTPYDRVKSYLQVNCAFCHQPGTLNAYWDARLIATREQMGILNNVLVTPRSVEKSFVVERLSSPGNIRMPPLASSVIDTNGIELFKRWILTMPGTPWAYRDLGVTGREGSAAIEEGTFTVAGAGTGLGAGQDAFHFLHRPLGDHVQVTVRMRSQFSRADSRRAGLMLRGAAGAEDAFVFIGMNADERPVTIVRTAPGLGADLVETNGPGPMSFLQIQREGDRVRTRYSPEGKEWFEGVTIQAPLGDAVQGGLAVMSGDPEALNVAEFDGFGIVAPRLLRPPDDSVFVAGEQVTLVAEPYAENTPIARARFFVNDIPVGEALTAPYYCQIQPSLPGAHTVVVRFTDAGGSVIGAPPVTFTVQPPPAAASWVGLLEDAGGDWPERFGTNGFLIAAHATNLPPFLTVALENADPLVWAEQTEETRALRRVDQEGRIASAWTAPDSFSIHVAAEDGAWHQLTAYALDWEGGRAQQVDLIQSGTGLVLDARPMTNFTGGLHLSWLFRGDVTLRVTGQDGSAPVLSGLFMDADPLQAPEVRIVTPEEEAAFVVPVGIGIEVSASDPDGAVSGVELFVNGQMVGMKDAPPYAFTWNVAQAGRFMFQARATDDDGRQTYSAPVHVNTRHRIAEAQFLHLDTVSQGDWIGLYGADGYLLPTYLAELPPYVSVIPANHVSHAWTGATEDRRAPQTVDRLSRQASAWVSTGTLKLDVIIQDDDPHLVTLYLLDWDSNLRRTRVDIVSGATGALLDTREMNRFQDGAHLTWLMRGHVQARLTRLAGNAVFSALFFDPLTPSYEAWGARFFTPEERADPAVGGWLGDPDGDGIRNRREYLLVLNPHEHQPELLPRTDIVGGHLTYSHRQRKGATDLVLVLEYSANLIDWEQASARAEPVLVEDHGLFEIITTRLTPPVHELPRGFLRLRALEP